MLEGAGSAVPAGCAPPAARAGGALGEGWQSQGLRVSSGRVGGMGGDGGELSVAGAVSATRPPPHPGSVAVKRFLHEL